MQRDCVTAVCCAYVRKVQCEVVCTLFLDMTSFVSAVGTVVACMLMQQRGSQFQPIFQEEGNTFSPIFFGAGNY